jgi:hypothetical protein
MHIRTTDIKDAQQKFTFQNGHVLIEHFQKMKIIFKVEMLGWFSIKPDTYENSFRNGPVVRTMLMGHIPCLS